MSVVVKDIKNQQDFIFAKGNTTAIESICDPNTVPDNYRNIINDFAFKGFRVIAIASKKTQQLYGGLGLE